MTFSEGWARLDALIEEACNPSRKERLSSEDVIRVKKYVKEIAPSYVYTRKISVKEPFTENVRKAMTENVKKSACRSLLGKDDNKLGRKDGEFVKGDQQIFNFARDEVFKNASTKRPAILNGTLTSYMRSIGHIKCGSVGGTCFLVTDVLVITNYHVYRMIEKEREKPRNSNLPITVLFDYLTKQMEKVVEVEVDEEQDRKLENPYVDYKFFRLKQNQGIRGRIPLGPMVRNWQLSDGRVIILGHPEGKEMQDEVCVVVGYRAMQERIRERHEQCTGVHMTNAQLLHNTEDYQGSLSYDTTFFAGASGSPVVEMNGNIVAMHTHAYSLEIIENISNQPENVQNQQNGPNQEQENVPNQEQGNVPNRQENVPNQLENVPNVPRQGKSRTYSLMEFGVQFISICRDMRHWHGEDVVKQIFPNYKLKPGEEGTDASQFY
jgi:V8-like Glu-specific endopeptidase